VGELETLGIESLYYMKRHLFYTFLVIFIVTTIITLLGVIGLIKIPHDLLWALVSAFLIELSGAVIFIYRRMDFSSLDDSPRHKVEPGVTMPETPPILKFIKKPKKRTLYDVLHDRLNKK